MSNGTQFISFIQSTLVDGSQGPEVIAGQLKTMNLTDHAGPISGNWEFQGTRRHFRKPS